MSDGGARSLNAVLFACNMNAVRSPMAAGLVNHYFKGEITAISAGVRPADEINGFAIACMAELGIDITKHQPHSFSELGEVELDLAISLTPEAHHQAVELTHINPVEFEYWPTIDPTLTMGNRDQVLASFREVRDNLLNKILDRFGSVKATQNVKT